MASLGFDIQRLSYFHDAVFCFNGPRWRADLSSKRYRPVVSLVGVSLGRSVETNREGCGSVSLPDRSREALDWPSKP